MKQRIAYWCATAALGIAEIFFAVMLVLSLLPQTNTFSIELREPVEVSSSALNLEKKQYVSQIRGVLICTGDQNLQLDALRITVGNGKETKEIMLEDLMLPSRLEQELFYEWQENAMYDRVLRVEGIVGERVELIANRASGVSLDAGTVLWLALAVVAGIFLTHFIKQHYYLAQEAQMSAKAE